jgi:hypothetical protein
VSEVNIVLEEFELLLHKLIHAAHCGDEQAMNNLNMAKEWLNNN